MSGFLLFSIEYLHDIKLSQGVQPAPFPVGTHSALRRSLRAPFPRGDGFM